MQQCGTVNQEGRKTAANGDIGASQKLSCAWGGLGGVFLNAKSPVAVPGIALPIKGS
jgi:hypothetical protein